MASSTSDTSLRYGYNEIEPLPFRALSELNVNNIVDPDPTGASFAVDDQHDLVYEKLRTIDPELGQLYQSLSKHSYALREYDAGFFWLRLPEPSNEEASRFCEFKFDFRTYRLPQRVIQAVRGCQADNALMISCIAIGNTTKISRIKTRVAFPRIFNLRPYKDPLHELLVRLLLASAGVDSSPLPTASQSKVFEGHDRMLSTVETQMPLPEVRLPSKRLRLRGAGIPNFFDVAWPTNETPLQSGGFIGFFHDHYHMSVKRPYQKAPSFEFIRVLINPKGVTSRRSMPRCLIACSSYRTQNTLFGALISIRIKQGMMRSSIPHWSPLHELMNCVSVAYQVMFHEMQSFITKCLSLLQDMEFHGRVHPWRSKFQYLHHLEDQVGKSRKHLTTTIAELDTWPDAKVSGVRLVSVPGARWAVRIRRLRRDASHLSDLLKNLDDRRIALHSMLKEQLDLNSGTRSLILTVLASIYVPLAFVSSYFGMNAKEFTNGGLVSTTTFWEVSIPVMVASIIVPIVFSGLLIRLATQALRSGYKLWLQHEGSVEFGIFLALNVASAVRGGLALFWTVWTANFLYVLKFLPYLREPVVAMLDSFQSYKQARAAWRSRSQQGTQMPATPVTATASQATTNPSEVDIVVQSADSEQANNVQTNTLAAISQGPVPVSYSASRSTVTKPSLLRFFLDNSMVWILLGGFALGATFLVLDILYHPKKRPSLSFYHSFALWFFLLHRILEYLRSRFRSLIDVASLALHLAPLLDPWAGLRSWWYQLAIRHRRGDRNEINEMRSRHGSGAESNRASAV